ncbi:hypothetical protein MKX01_026326 [Papaver californicum]|nr:hypothetical protein MKX01_026326 [Papaver californicum]
MYSGLGFILRLRNSVSIISNNSSKLSSRKNVLIYLLRLSSSLIVRDLVRSFCGYAVEQFSDDEYECDFENHKASSTVANVDDWKWKLSMLLRSEDDKEIISRDKRDRRDYEQISNLAKRMGLYCELYEKVVVASKVPLPNYRPDLDERRPQREVVIPLSLQRRVEGLLQEHLDRVQLNFGKIGDISIDSVVSPTENVNPDDPDSFLDGSVMEKVLQRRSSEMRDFQRGWQESPEGKQMLEFRKSLPARKEKNRLLTAIAQNHVIVISGETGCGKTTQLPQYILESEIESGRGAFCSIICTQPRRISAIGILLRRLLSDRNLDGITHVFVDEIHERGMNEGVYASCKSLEDVLQLTGYKLTSFNQVDYYGQDKSWKTQRQLLPRKRKNQITTLVEEALSRSSFESYSSWARDSLSCWTPDYIGFNLIEAVLCHICRKERPGAVLVFMTGWEDISCLRDQIKAHPLLGDPNRVLLLTCHGSMATSEQKLIFEKAPPNVRKIVLATNMAEASITINDIVFIVDCGKAKETTYDALNNTPCLLPSWISQASACQRRGRAGRVQSGDCYHLYPRCVYEAFAEYQLIELLRTPLNSLCLQIKSLQLGTLGSSCQLLYNHQHHWLTVSFYASSRSQAWQNACHGCYLPLFRSCSHCSGGVSFYASRDLFLLPQDKKDLAGTAKSRFSAKDYSDHMALVRAYEGWKDAERKGSAYEYCWRNFLSAQTLQAIHSLRKQFNFILKDAGLLETESSKNNSLSHNQSLVRAIICSGLFPGIAAVVHRESSMSFKTMDDGQVLLYANSVNARYQTIPYPWLVFGEKVKVNTVFIRDSTGVSDSILILFGGSLTHGVSAGHLKMLEGYIDFFMDPSLAECFWALREELDKLLQRKLKDPTLDIYKEGKYLMLSVQELLSADQCEGRFVFGRESKKVRETINEDRNKVSPHGKDGPNPKSLLQTLLMRAGHSPPKYKVKHLKTNEFRALVEFKAMQFVGKLKKNKQLAERDAAIEALAWLTHTSGSNRNEGDDSPPDINDNMLKLLGNRKKSKKS